MIKTTTFYGSNGPYLTVYTLAKWSTAKNNISICVHNFHRGDEDPDCHDHPFDFFSFVLWGGYREYLENGSHTVRKIFSFAYRTATHRHRVELRSRYCWTMCIKRDANRAWGFWQAGVFIPWRQYIEAKGLTPIDSSSI